MAAMSAMAHPDPAGLAAAVQQERRRRRRIAVETGAVTMQAITAGAVYFAAVFAAGFVLGVLRTLVLLPHVGTVLAVMVELPLILGFAWWACKHILRRVRLTPGEAVVMGTVAFSLLMLGEAGISVAMAGRSLSQHLALYAQAPHVLGLLGQLGFACLPWLQSRHGRAAAA